MTQFEKNAIYPADVSKWINTIKLNDDINIIGSIAYRSLKQYADIDLLETLDVDSNFTVWTYYQLLCNSINKMMSNGALFADIKLGNLAKYKQLTANIGYLVHSNVVNFNKSAIEIQIKTLDTIPIIKEELYNLINRYLASNETIDWEILNEYIRNLYTIHWTKNEFFNCFKYGPANEYIALPDYILSSQLKLDMLVCINDNWIEISTIHNISKNGVPVNFTPLTKEEIFSSIASNAEKFLFSPLFNSTYKGLKRIWILARMYEDIRSADLVASLINSDVNNLYLSKSYLESMYLIRKNKYIVDFSKEKANIGWLISHCTSINFNIEEVLSLLNKANSPEELHEIKGILSDMCNDYALQWIDKHNFQSTIYKYLKNKNEFI